MTTLHAPPRRAAVTAPPRHRFRPELLLWAVVAGALAVIGLWWRGTPSVSGLDGWLTESGRITGLLAGYGMAVLLGLMARVPALERGVGSDRLARWHAMGGRYVIGLVVAHVLTIIWGYAVADQSGVVDEAVTMALSFPDVLKATVAFFLLLGVALVSARAARRRMRYETWFYLHFYTYLAAWLAFGHQLATGAQFTGDRVAQVAWYVLYLGVAALLVWYRFLGPVRVWARHRLRVTRVTADAPGVVSIHLTGRRLARLGAEPGQFFRWRFLTRELWWSANPYSLSAAPDGGGLRITVKALGDHSAALARLRPGTRVIAEGPYGGFTGRLGRSPKSVLIAGGVGITPLRTLFETLPGQLTLLYRARTPEELLFRDELEEIARVRGDARLYCSVGSRSPDLFTGLDRLLPDLREHDAYVCGPPEMTRSAIQALRSAGVPAHRIHHESFEF
ncbi:ferric reductase-like transmembrane domain-containing protein [Nonomuraea sp. NEAU-A123]|uniref:ferredoxin reductase family protein n=1 Tax=Nonomuraea sp. NEAU-A123 TaxID=2839649 RepID=UPI001BE4B448|nr:ferredoxin reductase family protein [Nonomuraea sp. NEAU-A123]MBT2233062.1 ferric reductase-like transmembrane domain-containing protein [Nonomuraea sp. NEAU-A123]